MPSWTSLSASGAPGAVQTNRWSNSIPIRASLSQPQMPFLSAPGRDVLAVRLRSELQHALYRTRIRAVNRPYNLLSRERQYESENYFIDTDPVSFGRSSVLRQRYTNGHLEAERGAIENRSWNTQKQYGRL